MSATLPRQTADPDAKTPGGDGTTDVVICSTGMVSLPPEKGGAVEAYVLDLARIASTRSDFHVTVVTEANGGLNADPESRLTLIRTFSPIDSFPLKPLRSSIAHVSGGSFTALSAYKYLRRNTEKGQQSILHLNEEVSAILLSHSLPSVPKILTIHNPPPWIGGRSYPLSEYVIRYTDAKATLRFAIRKMAKIIALSTWMERFLCEGWKVPENKVVVLPLPVDTTYYSQGAMERFGKEQKTILSVGRLEQRKNVMELLRCMPMLRPEIRLEIIGSGPLRGQIDRFISANRLESRVSVTGGMSRCELVKRYQNAALLAHPSNLEAYPRVVAEAASCGLPVVLPDMPMYGDFIEGGFVRSYPEPADRAKLLECLTTTLSDHKLLQLLSGRAREFALAHNDYSSFAEKLCQLYQGVTQ